MGRWSEVPTPNFLPTMEHFRRLRCDSVLTTNVKDLPPTGGGVGFFLCHLRRATSRNWLEKPLLHLVRDYTELHGTPQEMHELHRTCYAHPSGNDGNAVSQCVLSAFSPLGAGSRRFESGRPDFADSA